MSVPVEVAVRDLLDTARALYGGDAPAQLDDLERRLAEPLRLAIAGIVKAGKSTLLNAIVGERVAATDAGECTRLVTWYRHATTRSVSVVARDGTSTRLPIHRAAAGHFAFDLNLPVDDVDRVEVGWPAPALKRVVLIDTPGIASLSPGTTARATGFLAPAEAAPAADAIIYLLRRLHPADMRFLAAFRDTAAGSSRTVNAIAVLSRADEIGSGRIDSLLSASKVARRYELDEHLRALALGVFPVAGLLAEGARTMRQNEFEGLRELAGLAREDREALLVSADRFVRLTGITTLGTDERRALMSRFGIFGVRLAASLIRAGVPDAPALTSEMTRQSGLDDLVEFVDGQFIGRTVALKAHGILEVLRVLLDQHPVDGASELEEGIERVSLRLSDVDELTLLSRARIEGLGLGAREDEAIRIVGGHGVAVHDRLGMDAGAEPIRLRQRLVERLDGWRAASHDPANDRRAVEAHEVVIRTLEELHEGLRARGEESRCVTSPAGGSELGPADTDDRAAADVMLSRGPRDGAGEDAHEHGEQSQAHLRGHQLP